MKPALFLKQTSASKVGFCVYDSAALTNLVDENLWEFEPEGKSSYDFFEMLETKLQNNLESVVIGFFEVEQSKKYGECNNAAQIKASAAKKGMGPKLYDGIMQWYGTLIPDRSFVSNAARGVWKYYSEKRKDVTKNSLDNVKSPKTPQKNDDCQFIGDEESAFLNYSYSMGGESWLKPLQPVHVSVGKKITGELAEAGMDADPKDFDNFVYGICDKYFSQRFSTTESVKVTTLRKSILGG